MARCVEEIIPSMGSKYIQSYSYKAFKEIKKGGKFLITGTPCQIASMRRYVRMRRIEDDVILMDFFVMVYHLNWYGTSMCQRLKIK